MLSFRLHALYRHDRGITKGEGTKMQGSSDYFAANYTLGIPKT